MERIVRSEKKTEKREELEEEEEPETHREAGCLGQKYLGDHLTT